MTTKQGGYFLFMFFKRKRYYQSKCFVIDSTQVSAIQSRIGNSEMFI